MPSGHPPLLLFLALASDPHRMAVGPALAAAAEAAGWEFDLYYDQLRRGRHFGGGDPGAAPPGLAGGTLAAGGGHAEQLLWLGSSHSLVAVGDPRSLLWPAVEACGGEVLLQSSDPAEVFGAVLQRLGREAPSLVRVLDAGPQAGLITAPYLYPAFFDGEPALGVDASASEGLRRRLEELGARIFHAHGLGAGSAERFPGGLDQHDPLDASRGYAVLTSDQAKRHAGWGRGVLLGDPELVAAQLPKARRLRLLPLYGAPQTEAIAAASDVVRAAREPVYGRQWDDSDFFVLAEHGHGLQVLDPSPPFDASRKAHLRIPEPARSLWETEPSDAELERWADEGRVLVTLLLWAGMIRELDCLPRLIDLVAETGMHAGLVLTAETLEARGASPLGLLSAPPDQGGVFGLLEPLVGSTGRGVAAEAYLPPGALQALLGEALAAASTQLPAGLRPRGMWPLLDARLQPHRSARVTLRSGRPAIRFASRGMVRGEGAGSARGSMDVRGAIGRGVRGARFDRFFEEWRPFDQRRPGGLDPDVAGAVKEAGFSYMWTKAGFGSPRPAFREGDFVALPFTAGSWDGWSPFYTVGAASDLRRAERRLLRSGGPGWLASTVDSPLWALPGEIWEHGGALHELARAAAAGGTSGRLINVTPHVVARYARLLGEL